MNMKRFMNKKVVAIGLAAGITLGGAGAAFAYFTSNGTGTQDVPGAVGSSSSVTVTNISVSGLVPGGPAEPVLYKFTNGGLDQNFGTASVAVNSITGSAGCTLALADLSTANSASAVGEVSANASFTSSTSTEPTITMNDNGNQDTCQGATVNLTVTIAQGS